MPMQIIVAVGIRKIKDTKDTSTRKILKKLILTKKYAEASRLCIFKMVNVKHAKISLDKLTFFIKNGLNNYSSKRNFDFGPDKRSNVSNLSPYIRKRIIHEIESITGMFKL